MRATSAAVQVKRAAFFFEAQLCDFSVTRLRRRVDTAHPLVRCTRRGDRRLSAALRIAQVGRRLLQKVPAQNAARRKRWMRNLSSAVVRTMALPKKMISMSMLRGPFGTVRFRPNCALNLLQPRQHLNRKEIGAALGDHIEKPRLIQQIARFRLIKRRRAHHLESGGRPSASMRRAQHGLTIADIRPQAEIDGLQNSSGCSSRLRVPGSILK